MVSIKELAKFGLFKSQMQDLFRGYIIIIHTQMNYLNFKYSQ